MSAVNVGAFGADIIRRKLTYFDQAWPLLGRKPEIAEHDEFSGFVAIIIAANGD